MRNTGYTLIEILIVLVIMGLAFTIGYVGFRDFARKQSLITIANEVKADIKLAQEQAIAGKKPSGCTGYLRGYSFTFDSSTSFAVKAVCNTDITVKQRGYPSSNITFSPYPSPNPILFKTLGQGTNLQSGQNAVIQINQVTTGNYQLITVGYNGEIN